MSAAVDAAASSEPRYPTTGEPVSVNARRNRLGVWLCIVSDATGVVALLIAYAYLWSLNVNNAWAPPNDAWAAPLPFWAIFAGTGIAALVMWWGVRGIAAGQVGRLATACAVAGLVVFLTFVGQIGQLVTFPFGPSDGAYATTTFWLALASAIHLALVLFLVPSILTRVRAGRITPDNHSHARFVAMWMTFVTVAILLGAVFATTMTDSPNPGGPAFGTFSES